MKSPVSIQKKSAFEQDEALNFNFLRQHAIELLQKTCGDIWTDYNIHDPGVTILEQLCYAITDLGYRTDFPIEDLLTNAKGEISLKNNSFYLKQDLLFSHPVTIADFRKYLIDELDEIDNVWLEFVNSKHSNQALKGIYRITVQVNHQVAHQIIEQEEEENRIKQLIKKVFVAKRNLGEDVDFDIIILKPTFIAVEADVLIQQVDQAEQILAQIYHQISLFISSRVNFYTENELLRKGFQIEQIYDGPKLKNGIILTDELREQKKDVDPVDIIQVIANVKGVVQVKGVTISLNGEESSHKPIPLSKNQFPLFEEEKNQKIQLSTGQFNVKINQSIFKNAILKLYSTLNRKFIPSFYNVSSALQKGVHRSQSTYYSIQDQFPIIYGIGREGIPTQEDTPQRRGQAKQLKAYLIFFEQIITNYLVQLNHLEHIFNANSTQKFSPNPYLYHIPEVKDLLKAFTDQNSTIHQKDKTWNAFKKDTNNQFQTALKQISIPYQRFDKFRSEQLNHMLARFNEIIVDYPVKVYREIYHLNSLTEYEELDWKARILNHTVELNSARTLGWNYLDEKESKRFNFERKIRMLLYLPEVGGQKKLASIFDDPRIRYSKLPSEDLTSPSLPPTDGMLLGDLNHILLSDLEFQSLIENDLVLFNGQTSREEFLFSKYHKGVLVDGIDAKNYKVAKSLENKEELLLLFKAQQADQWKVISVFGNEDEAILAINKITHFFKFLSIESEGLYLVDHTLLRPALNTASFGFKYIGENGKVLFSCENWMNFSEREQLIDDYLNFATHEYAGIFDFKGIRFNEKTNALELKESLNARRKNLKNNHFSNEHYFEMYTRGVQGELLSETFFNDKVTFVFPAWPARFQSEGFKRFAINLITTQLPAHLQVDFKWFGVSKMREFEDAYFDWKEALAMQTKEKQQKAILVIAKLK